MTKYRKRPVIIEVYQFKGGLGKEEYPKWIIEAIENGHANSDPTGESFWIKTLEGVMIASPGDWLIRGIRGEIYPCKPDIFEATYEKVED